MCNADAFSIKVNLGSHLLSHFIGDFQKVQVHLELCNFFLKGSEPHHFFSGF